MDQTTISLKALTSTQVAHYREHGYLSPVNALTAGEAREVRALVESVEAKYDGQWPRAWSLKSHLIFTALDRVVHHPKILDAVEDILGPDILCWSSRWFIKDKNDGGFVSWHQDVPYWGLDVSENIVTAWVAITPATRANGCMKVIPGSQRKLVAHREGVSNNLLLRGQEVAVTVDEKQAVYMALAQGQMSFHHGLMFHGSEESHDDERRLGFAIRYIPTRVKPIDGLPKDSVQLVRGVDRYHHFNLESRPFRDLDPVDVARHKQATDTYHEINRLAVAKHDELIAQGAGARA
ncbi:MAG: phytanoyl-CoA dioxygenase [Betaproteobacteria bacterium]|nr:phytanoyl-CoA dioxygenase [Betaproteobacteria bacterium]